MPWNTLREPRDARPQRAHRGDRLEVVVQPGGTHSELSGETGDAETLVVALADQLDGLGDSVCAAGAQRDLAQPATLLSERQSVHDFADREGVELAVLLRAVELSRRGVAKAEIGYAWP